MNSMPSILARLTGSELTIVGLLILWLFVRFGMGMTNGAQRRRTRRHTVLLPVEVDGKKGLKGLTSDLSIGGCKITSNLALRSGQHLTLRLHLPGQEPPIVVERAAVRWVVGKNFGLQFMSLLSSERERLEGLRQWVA
jgi:PilZ domain